MNNPTIPSLTRMLRRQEVENRTGLKRSTIYEAIAKGTFPRPVRVGTKAVCWVEIEIEAWLQEKIKNTRGECK
jgi:prophage regulatory protein